MKPLSLNNLFSVCFMLTIAFFFTSCMNDLSVNEAELKQDTEVAQLYNKVIDAENVETRKLIFQSLDATEKADFWLHHTDLLINSKMFTDNQIAFLEDTKAFLKKDGITSDEAEAYFTATPKSIFSQDELIEMFASPIYFGEQKITGPSGLVVAIGCTCSANWHCRLTGGVCNEDANCERWSFGCGFLGTAVCTGWCVGIAGAN